MEKWQVEFVKQIREGVPEDRAANVSAGLSIEAVKIFKTNSQEFSAAWDEAKNTISIPLSVGTLVPDLPNTDDIGELCRSVSVQTTKKLIDIALYSESETNSLKAISEINDRGWGKSPQAVKHSGEIDVGLAGLLEAARQRRQITNE